LATAGLDRTEDRLHQGAAEPFVASTGRRRAPLAAALPVAGADLGPGDEVCVGGEPGHIDAGLGEDLLSPVLSDAGDVVEKSDGGPVGAHPLLDLVVDGVELVLQLFDHAEQAGNREALGRTDRTSE